MLWDELVPHWSLASITVDLSDLSILWQCSVARYVTADFRLSLFCLPFLFFGESSSGKEGNWIAGLLLSDQKLLCCASG